MNSKPPSTLTRRELDLLPRIDIHKSRNWSKADVYATEWPQASGRRVVVKDLKGKPLLFRIFIGRPFLQREWRALLALQGLPGITPVVARPDADAFVIEFCDGRKAVQFERGQLSQAIVERADAILQAAHERGVTHGDLHSDNLLIDDNGQVTLIDWATAQCFGVRRGAWKEFVFNEWRGVDQRSIAKLKITHAPWAINARERELLLRGGSKIYRNVKKLRLFLHRLRGGSNEEVMRVRNKHRYRAKKYFGADPNVDTTDDSHTETQNAESTLPQSQAAPPETRA
jgi:serine/threonine protein kinase